MTMSIRARTAAGLLLPLLAGCASAGTDTAAPPSHRLAPLVDHHAHIMSAAMISSSPPLPFIELPAELDAVLDARNAAFASGDLGDLFLPDALVLEPLEGVWLRGEDGLSEIEGLYTSDSRIFANGYTLGVDAATITGVMRSGDYQADELNFAIALQRDASGAWRIASETASLLPPRLFKEEISAADLIADLDDAGIARAVMLSVAYWHGEEEVERAGELEDVRAENDWTVAQAALYPDRLFAFCGIPPIRDYADDEVRRCARELGVRGIKMHFRSADVNLHDSRHVEYVRRVFEAANEEGLAIVVHSETPDQFGVYDRDEAEIFVNQILPAAPDVVVQIAHMWGGNELSPEALDVYANLVSSGDARGRNLWFDLTEIVDGAGGDPEKLALIARYARQIGMDRLLYGSDASGSPDLPPSTLGWGEIRRELPLTAAELADIADNVAPYLR